jgi:hypothetical protein
LLQSIIVIKPLLLEIARRNGNSDIVKILEANIEAQETSN